MTSTAASTHWVVVADEARARFFAGDDLLKDLVELHDFVHPPARLADRDLKSDRPGRLSKGQGRRTSADPRTTPEAVEAGRFARVVASSLLDGHREGRFDRVVIVAPPRFLGVLRAELDEQVARRVVGEIPKEITRMTLKEIVAALHRHLTETAGMPDR